MVRHGESEWNQQNLFGGWVNVGLSSKGLQEAKRAGQAIKDAGYKFDIAYTSVLARAQETLDAILKEIEQTDIQIVHSWRLNERHYGALTGLNKSETAEIFGEEQVKLWRRSYDIPPPPMEEDHPYYKQISENTIYENGPSPEEFPKFESLKMTINRLLPFWNETIVPKIKSCKRVLIVAHSNSLRGIIKHIDRLSDEEIADFNVPLAMPFIYVLDGDLNTVADGRMKFLGDPEVVKKAIEDVSNEANPTDNKIIK